MHISLSTMPVMVFLAVGATMGRLAPLPIMRASPVICRVPTRELLVHSRPPDPCPPQSPTKPPRLPVLHRPPPLNINDDAVPRYFFTISVLVSSLHVLFLCELDKGVSFEFARVLVHDHLNLCDLPVDFELTFQLALSEIVGEAAHEEGFDGVRSGIRILAGLPGLSLLINALLVLSLLFLFLRQFKFRIYN